MNVATYDWAWRKRARETDGVMTFHRIMHEAVEICSSDLFLRRVYAKEFVVAAYLHGHHDVKKDDVSALMRRIDIAFVRAYLFERRAGLQPREAGPPAGADIAIHEGGEDAKRASDNERERHRSIANGLRKANKERERGIAQDRADDALSSLLGHEYQHYEGGRYRVLSTSVDKPTNKVLVLYYSTGVARSMRWTCTLEHFTERVIVTGNPMPRFKKISDNI